MAIDLHLSDDDIKDMVSDYNGDMDFRTDEAQFGYIDRNQYLVLPDNQNYFKLASPANEIEKKTRARVIATICAYNVPALGGNADAVKYAYLRAKLVGKGYLYDYGGGIGGDRKVYTDEIRIATQADHEKVTVEIQAAVKAFLKSPERAFVDKYWRVLASICAHVVAVRAHHFKEGVVAEQSYEAVYNRLWRACAIDDKLPFTDLKKLYRTALHPFGLLALAEIYDDGTRNSRLPRTLLMRADAMPAGAAKPGTALAIINLMRAAAWFGHWQAAFQNEINLIQAAVDKIKEDRYSFHVAHNLYGKVQPDEASRKVYEFSEAAARALAPYLVGYVSVECVDSPIQAQMTLRQAADDQIGLKNRFMRFLQGVARKADADSSITAILPPVQANVAPPEHVEV